MWNSERLSLLALHFVPGIGYHLIRQLISYCGSAENVFKSPRGKLLKIPGIGHTGADAIRAGRPFQIAEEEFRKTEKVGVDLLFYTDRKYPSRLKGLPDAPTLLYAKGSMDLENDKIVAVVGTRSATSYGKNCVEDFVKGLAPHGALVLSGLAYGIDAMAHREAIRNNLQTVGVLGSGIDVIYPSSHREIANKMLMNGGLLSENPFGAKPDAHNFPSRNRIIAGLCDALIVVEAAQHGGALITANIANSYNKDVFAFPGGIREGYSEGCNNLIKKNQAHLMTGISDLEYIMNWSPGTPSKSQSQSPGFDDSDCTPEERTVLLLLREKNRSIVIDELSWISGFSVSQLASILLSLEFKGLVHSSPGKLFGLKTGKAT